MAFNASPASALSARPLSINFRATQAAYYEVDGSTLGGADPALQQLVGKGLALCEAALMQVENQAIFSSNERADDINTCDLKYLLLPFYRGELLLRVANQDKRYEALREALKCLRGFVADLERLEMLTEENKGWQEMGASASSDPATVRNQKIARLKANKAAKQQLEVLAAKLGKRGKGGDEGEGEEDGDDDELEREQLALQIQCACHTALDSVRAAEQEADMLKQISKLRRPDGSLPPAPTAAEEDPALGLQFLSLLPPPGALPGVPPAPGSGGGGRSSLVDAPIVNGFAQTNPLRDPNSRLSYATAMRQIHTGEIPGLYTFSVEEGLRAEEAERALGDAAKMQAMSEREAARAEVRRPCATAMCMCMAGMCMCMAGIWMCMAGMCMFMCRTSLSRFAQLASPQLALAGRLGSAPVLAFSPLLPPSPPFSPLLPSPPLSTTPARATVAECGAFPAARPRPVPTLRPPPWAEPPPACHAGEEGQGGGRR